MPTATIDCTPICPNNTIEAEEGLLPRGNDSLSTVMTPHGLAVLEIQGELNLPDHRPVGTTQTPQTNDSPYITVDDIYDAVKFGHLEFDKKDESKVTLFIGKSQRLIGNIVKLDTPLGLLKIPLSGANGMNLEDDQNDKDKDDASESTEKVQMIDIVKAKMIFKHRPLPIM